MPRRLEQQKEADAHTLLDFGMAACERQLDRHDWALHEHPHGAVSWSEPSVISFTARPGVDTVRFVQCALGLTTPVTRLPLRKRTRFATNIPDVLARFRQIRCSCSRHGVIQGTDHGIRISKHAQCYPPAMCALLAECFESHLTNCAP